MKRAMTLLELVFVIVIIGIISAVAIPQGQDNRDELQKIKSAISFTKHLAQNDYKTEDEWFKHLWRISIQNEMIIWQDLNGNNTIDDDEIALNSFRQKLDGRVNSQFKTSVITNTIIAFDRFGRPIDPDTIGDEPYSRKFKEYEIESEYGTLVVNKTGYIFVK